jgi:four helix bundle protein
VGDYRKLRCWNRAHECALKVYKATETFPATERYGLVCQMRGAAVSVVSNIAEGIGRNRSSETAQYIRMALGSCTELESQVLLSRDLAYLNDEVANQLVTATTALRGMLASLQRCLTAASSKTTSSHRLPDS